MIKFLKFLLYFILLFFAFALGVRYHSMFNDFSSKKISDLNEKKSDSIENNEIQIQELDNSSSVDSLTDAERMEVENLDLIQETQPVPATETQPVPVPTTEQPVSATETQPVPLVVPKGQPVPTITK